MCRKELGRIFNLFVCALAWWKREKPIERILYGISIAFFASYIVIGFLALLPEIIVGFRIIFRYRSYWMAGNMNWLTDDTLVPVLAFAAFMVSGLVMSILLVFKPIKPFLERVIKDFKRSDNEQKTDIEVIKGSIAAMETRIKQLEHSNEGNYGL